MTVARFLLYCTSLCTVVCHTGRRAPPEILKSWAGNVNPRNPGYRKCVIMGHGHGQCKIQILGIGNAPHVPHDEKPAASRSWVGSARAACRGSPGVPSMRSLDCGASHCGARTVHREDRERPDLLLLLVRRPGCGVVIEPPGPPRLGPRAVMQPTQRTCVHCG